MGPGFHRTAVALAALALTNGCSSDDATPSVTAELSGRVSGSGSTGRTIPLTGVRVVARAIDPDDREDPMFHARPGEDVVIAETITDADGRYALEVPRGWVSLAFEQAAWMRAYRTQNTTFDRARSIDVELSPVPPLRTFAMPQAGDAAVVLELPAANGREYTRLHVEPGDLVGADGTPVVGSVFARVDAPDPASSATWAPGLVSTTRGVLPLDAYALVSVELSSGGKPVEVAPGATLAWEIVVPAERRDDLASAWYSGVLRNHSLDTRSGLWIEEPARIDLIDGGVVVERTHFSAGALGESPEPEGAPCGRGTAETIIGLDAVYISGTPVVASGTESADVGSNGNINVSGNAVVHGTASSSGGTVTSSGKAKVTGGTMTGVDPFVAPIPEDDFTRVRAANDNGEIATKLTSGALKLSSSQSVFMPAGEYAVTSLELSAKSKLECTGSVRVYVAGTVKVSGQAKMNTDGACDLVILSDAAASMSFSGGSIMHATIYAPRASVSFSGNGTGLRGAIVGRTVSITGTFDFLGEDDPYVVSGVCEPEEPSGDDGGDDDDGDAGDDDGGDEGSTSGDPESDDGELPRIPDLPD